MAPYFPKYRKFWEDLPELKEWLSPMEGDITSAFCRVCCRPLHAHKKDLLNHAKTKKHHKNVEKYRNVVESYENTLEFPEDDLSVRKNVKQEVIDNQLLMDDPELDSTVKNITIAVFSGSKGSHEIETQISEGGVNDDVEGTASITIDAQTTPEALFLKLRDVPEFKSWLFMKPESFFCTLCKKDFKHTRTDTLRHASSKFHQHNCRKSGITPFQADNASILGILFGKDPYEKKRKIIDLRSDTVTKPSSEMKEIMLHASIGDDSFGDDPSVKGLESKIAILLDKEAGLLMPSGTMSNLVAVMTHCATRDSEVIVGDESHIAVSSMIGITRMGGIMNHRIKNTEDGTFSLETLKNLVEQNLDFCSSLTTLVCIENPHNRCGGRSLPFKWIQELGEFCKDNNLLLHLDGSRLLHASIASGISPAHLSRHCHSVSFCLNKGLGAPLGSVLVGSTEFIERARKLRGQLGGTMHQAGMFASAATFALKNYSSLLHVDHANAREIAHAVNEMYSTAVMVDLACVQTNVVFLRTDNIRLNAKELCDRLSETRDSECTEVGQFVKILVKPMSQTVVRVMTHFDLSKWDIKLIIKKLKLVISEYDNMLNIQI